jgi:hypothetical protein
MDPLITNGVDPALLRVLEKHGHERDSEMRRRRPPASPPAEENENEDESGPDSPRHQLDDLA